MVIPNIIDPSVPDQPKDDSENVENERQASRSFGF